MPKLSVRHRPYWATCAIATKQLEGWKFSQPPTQRLAERPCLLAALGQCRSRRDRLELTGIQVASKSTDVASCLAWPDSCKSPHGHSDRVLALVPRLSLHRLGLNPHSGHKHASRWPQRPVSALHQLANWCGLIAQKLQRAALSLHASRPKGARSHKAAPAGGLGCAAKAVAAGLRSPVAEKLRQRGAGAAQLRLRQLACNPLAKGHWATALTQWASSG